jgi:hypothetical protein
VGLVIHTSEIMNALISAGLTYSPEAGDPYPMREKPCADVAAVVAEFLANHGVAVYHDVPKEVRHG